MNQRDASERINRIRHTRGDFLYVSESGQLRYEGRLRYTRQMWAKKRNDYRVEGVWIIDRVIDWMVEEDCT